MSQEKILAEKRQLLYKQFLSDPARQQIMLCMDTIISKAIPQIIIYPDGHTETIYDEVTQKALDQLAEQLKSYTLSNYKDLF